MDVVPPLDLPPLSPDLYINRELSWLAFNRRVLEEASEQALPLLERIKFVAIFSANLDEFFMIRVANLKRKLTAGIIDPGPDGRTPAQLASVLRTTVQELLDDQSAILRNDLMPALATERIEIVRISDLSSSECERLERYFERDIFPVLTPQAVDRERRFPHVSNQSLNLIVRLHTPTTGARFARIKIPAVLNRLVPVGLESDEDDQDQPRRERFVWLEDLVAANLSRLFPGNTIVASFPFHVIRDSDIDIDEDDVDDARDLLITMEQQLSMRTFGSVVMLLVDTTMPEDVRIWLTQQLHAEERDVYVVDGPLALESLFELLKLDRPELIDRSFTPSPLGRLPDPQTPEQEAFNWESTDLFEQIRQRDVLIHHPYQSFGAVIDFLRIASRDPHVVGIKQTLYRIGKDSPLIPTLIEARDDDTQVAVLVELKARFDEVNNIAWAQALEQRGVHVAYGLAGLKTHCKLMLVVRREEDGLRRYAHLSTGNYNASTARIYEDIGILTANEEIASDVSELFNVMTGFSNQDSYRKLWVAPMHLRVRFLEKIAREVEIHRRTGAGRLIFKMNSLVDRELIRALYAASQAGVEIDLIVRGICCLRPGVPGWSERIRVRSLVGRFLEHSRIYYFGNGGSGEIYLGSADLMERNLDRRVEVVFPVEDEANLAHLRDVVLPAYLRDTANARELRADGTYVPLTPTDGSEPFDVQRWLAELYRLPTG
ncbi:MAG: polyphosphate kinase 1 [Thermomicrobiales bacterium]|nr:polyphosphate kinase 1 [Thermomicrobiales bacterium]